MERVISLRRKVVRTGLEDVERLGVVRTGSETRDWGAGLRTRGYETKAGRRVLLGLGATIGILLARSGSDFTGSL